MIPNLDASPLSLEMGECGTSWCWRPLVTASRSPDHHLEGEVEGREAGLQEHLGASPCFSPARRLQKLQGSSLKGGGSS